MFKEKDRVKHKHTGYEGIVSQVYGDGNIFVIFDGKDILPCRLPADEYELIFSIDKMCPKCGSEWAEIQLFRSTVYECLKCNVKKEEVDETTSYTPASKL